MTNTENLFLVAEEECAEIQQAISKGLRFGMDSYHPDRPNETNNYEIMKEYHQLEAVMEMLIESGELIPLKSDEIAKIKEDKKSNVEKYAKLSRQLGRIN